MSSNDPNSYRVPILHLKDIDKDPNEESKKSSRNPITSGSSDNVDLDEFPEETTPAVDLEKTSVVPLVPKKEVKDDDVKAAVITPAYNVKKPLPKPEIEIPIVKPKNPVRDFNSGSDNKTSEVKDMFEAYEEKEKTPTPTPTPTPKKVSPENNKGETPSGPSDFQKKSTLLPTNLLKKVFKKDIKKDIVEESLDKILSTPPRIQKNYDYTEETEKETPESILQKELAELEKDAVKDVPIFVEPKKAFDTINKKNEFSETETVNKNDTSFEKVKSENVPSKEVSKVSKPGTTPFQNKDESKIDGKTIEVKDMFEAYEEKERLHTQKKEEEFQPEEPTFTDDDFIKPLPRGSLHPTPSKNAHAIPQKIKNTEEKDQLQTKEEPSNNKTTKQTDDATDQTSEVEIQSLVSALEVPYIEEAKDNDAFGAISDGPPLDIWEKAEQTKKTYTPPIKPVVTNTKETDKSKSIISENISVPQTQDDEILAAIKKDQETKKQNLASEDEKNLDISSEKQNVTPPLPSNLSSLRERLTEKGAEETNMFKTPVGMSGYDASSKIETEKTSKPETKHAKVIADVSDRLSKISNQSPEEKQNLETENIPKNTQSQETNYTRGELHQEINHTPSSGTSTSVPSVRTFKSDVEQAILKNKTSVVDMVSAEQKSKGLGETVRKGHRNTRTFLSVILMWASAILVLGGISFGSFFLFRYITGDTYSDRPDIVSPNNSIPHDITGQTSTEILEGLTKVGESSQAPLGTITQLKIIERIDENNTETRVITTSEFFEKLRTNAPGSLIRDTSDDMTIGVHKLLKNNIFWVFKVDHYDVSHKGMLEWEFTLRKDLSPLFGEYKIKQVEIEESEPAATSTDIDSIKTTSRRIIVDDIYEDTHVLNTPARGLKDTNGEYILLWSMPNKNTVVITTNIDSMQTLVERMQANID